MPSPDLVFQTEPEPVVDYLYDHAPEPPRQTVRLLMILGVIVLVVLLMRFDGWIGWVTPWVALGGLLFWMSRQRGRWIDVQQRMQSLRELTMLRRHEAACAEAWRALPKLRHDARLHGQTAMIFAANLMGLDHYDAAIATHDYLLEHIPAEHPVAVLIRLQRVMAYLRTDQLRTADEELRALGRIPLGGFPAALHASGLLYQQIKTHHHADVLATYDLDPSLTVEAGQEDPRDLDPLASGDDDEADDPGFDDDGRAEDVSERAETDAQMTRQDHGDDPVATFCPLGIEAAYAYAMLAVALHHRGDLARARAWWTAATRLRPADELIEDVPELAVLQGYPPAPSLQAVLRADGSAATQSSGGAAEPSSQAAPMREHPQASAAESTRRVEDAALNTTESDRTAQNPERDTHANANTEHHSESREERD